MERSITMGSSRDRRVLVLVTIAIALLPATSRAAWLTEIGVPPNCSSIFTAALSADGSTAVGFADCDGPRGFRWTRASGVTLIGVTFPKGVSADGAVVVGAGFGDAFRWTETSGTVRLAPIPGDDYAEAYAVSGDGSVVVGMSEGAPEGSFRHQASRWTEAEGMVGLGFLAGDTYSDALGISADGAVVVGESRVGAGSQNNAFRWTSGAGMVALGLLPGATESIAYATSDDGSVVVGSSGGQAFRWTASDGMTSLGPGAALAVSGDGSVVVGDGPNGAFAWDAVHGMRSVQDALSKAGVDLPAWGFGSAGGVSSDGQTIGVWGLDDQGHFYRTGVANLRPDCSDGIDNDGDGKLDFDGGASANHGVALGPADPGCPLADAAPENPQCDDGIDNDGNGLVDFADPKCSAAWPYWEKAPTCGLGAELSLVMPLLIGLRRARGTRSQGTKR